VADSSGRFVRWQSIQVTQLGFVLNLVMGFAVAGLGLWVSLLRDISFHPQCQAKYLFVLSASLFLISIASGIWCALNRLWDFRITTGIARGKWTGDELKKKEIRSEKLGDRTWMLLYSEVSTFALATLLLIATLAQVYWCKLF
jgi:hypothetical protein